MGGGNTTTQSSAPMAGGPNQPNDVMRVGDKITVRLTGVPEDQGFINEIQIPASGDITVPLLTRSFHATGRTTADLAAEITGAYQTEKIFSTPNITIIPEERYVNVGGDVRAPMRVLYTPDLTLLGAINACGGFDEYANRRAVRILRGGQVITIDCVAATPLPRRRPPPSTPATRSSSPVPSFSAQDHLLEPLANLAALGLKYRMLAKRVIPCLDVHNGSVTRGQQFGRAEANGLRNVGDPVELAIRYNEQGADELVFFDITASSEGRKSIIEVIERTADRCFMPLTVGGGVRSVEDMRALLRAGADKISLNSAALARPEIIAEGAAAFGRQCMVVSIDAKKTAPGEWSVFSRGGRDRDHLGGTGVGAKGGGAGRGGDRAQQHRFGRDADGVRSRDHAADQRAGAGAGGGERRGMGTEPFHRRAG